MRIERLACLLFFGALAVGGCKPAPCKPTEDVRHRAKVLVERYPAQGDETRAVVKELRAAIAAQPDAKVQPWKMLDDAASGLADILADMDNPNLEPKKRTNAAAILSQRKQNFLSELNDVRDTCKE